MPEDKSSEQPTENQDFATSEDAEMTQEEQEALFDEIDPDEPEVEKPADDSDDEGEDDEEEGEDDDDEESEDEDEESEDEDDSGDDDDEEDDSDDEDEPTSAADKLKAMAQERKAKKAQEDADAEIEKRVREREEEIKEEVRKEFVQADKITGPDGEEVDLKEMRDEYPDIFAALEAMSFKLATDMHNKAVEKGQFVSREDFEAAQAERAQERFVSDIQKRHPDIDVDQLPENKEFWEWLDDQDDDTRSFMEDGSQTVAGVSAVLDAFKEATVKSANKKIDKKAAKKKKKHNDLHGSTSRTERRPRKAKPGKDAPMTEKEQEALFANAEVD